MAKKSRSTSAWQSGRAESGTGPKGRRASSSPIRNLPHQASDSDSFHYSYIFFFHQQSISSCRPPRSACCVTNRTCTPSPISPLSPCNPVKARSPRSSTFHCPPSTSYLPPVSILHLASSLPLLTLLTAGKFLFNSLRCCLCTSKGFARQHGSSSFDPDLPSRSLHSPSPRHSQRSSSSC